jgi:hypothetical protein
MDKPSDKYKVICVYVALALSTLVVYWQVRNYDFVNFDDPHYVHKNPIVQSGITLDSIKWAFTTGHAANWHPLTWLSHMLDCQLFGTNPGWHHLTNLLLHIANTLLLFAVLKRMTGALWRSAFVAALFALHPLNVESVAWVAERKNVLSGFFWMLTVAAYIRYAERPGIGSYLLVVLVFSLALMAKPIVVTLPFVLLLLDYWPFGRFQWGSQRQGESLPQSELVKVNYQTSPTSRLVGEKVPLFILVAVLSMITFFVQRSGGTVESTATLTLKARSANAVVSYAGYIGKIFWPRRLAVFYPHPRYSLPVWQAVAAGLLLLGITVCVIWLARRRCWLPVGWLWYLGTLVPVIGLVQVGAQAMADRYAYVPAVGLFIIIAWSLPELVKKWRYRKIGLRISAGIVLTFLLLCTRMQVRHWQNSVTLFEHALAVTENNYAIHCNYGRTLMRIAGWQRHFANWGGLMKLLCIIARH